MPVLLFSCTQSKTASPTPQLKLRNHSGEPTARLKSWCEAVGDARVTHTIQDLYKGGYWRTALRAVETMPVQTQAYVVSAGLGLVPFGTRVAPYAATFSAGHQDSIPGAGNHSAAAKWWAGLEGPRKLRIALRTNSKASPPALISVLTLPYLEAVAPTLRQLLDEGVVEEVVLLTAATRRRALGGLEKHQVKLDARMSRIVGGRVGDLTVRVLTHFLENAPDTSLTVSSLQRWTSNLIPADAPAIYSKRQKCSEQDVRDWLHDTLTASNPPTSATAALRAFRASERGFEQKHFFAIYRAVAAELNAALPTSMPSLREDAVSKTDTP